MNLDANKKSGANLTALLKLLLKNPVYSTAGKNVYNYFLEHNEDLCGDVSDFDSQHSISTCNKTDGKKFEDVGNGVLHQNLCS